MTSVPGVGKFGGGVQYALPFFEIPKPCVGRDRARSWPLLPHSQIRTGPHPLLLCQQIKARLPFSAWPDGVSSHLRWALQQDHQPDPVHRWTRHYPSSLPRKKFGHRWFSLLKYVCRSVVLSLLRLKAQLDKCEASLDRLKAPHGKWHLSLRGSQWTPRFHGTLVENQWCKIAWNHITLIKWYFKIPFEFSSLYMDWFFTLFFIYLYIQILEVYSVFHIPICWANIM